MADHVAVARRRREDVEAQRACRGHLRAVGIPKLACRQTLACRIDRAKLALDQRRLQLRPERFERNHRRNRYERIILFVETFIASVQIEEAKLSHANIPRSESRSFESDLRGGGKGEFFEVP